MRYRRHKSMSILEMATQIQKVKDWKAGRRISQAMNLHPGARPKLSSSSGLAGAAAPPLELLSIRGR